MPVGIRDFAVPEVSGDRGDQVMHIEFLAIPQQKALAGKRVTQIMNPGTRQFAIALRPTQNFTQFVNVSADRTIGQMVPLLVDKQGAVVMHVQRAKACLRVTAQGAWK